MKTFIDPNLLQRLRVGPLAPYLDAYLKHIEQEGFLPSSAPMQMYAIARFSKWLRDRQFDLYQVDEAAVNRFLKRDPGVVHSCECATLRRLLAMLRQLGVTVAKASEPVRNPLDGATAWLMGYRNPGTLQFLTPGDREIVMKRAFWAPRERVFDAFVNPKLLKQWFYGTPGGTLAVCEVALKANEPFRYVWRDADGREMGMRGVCLQFTRPERIVATEQFDEPWYPGGAVGTIELQQYSDITVLTQTIRYDSRVARDKAVETQMEHAVALGYDRLETLLASLEHKKRRKG
jgi:uncharacterized protein YndB with AHSA1/START domain